MYRYVATNYRIKLFSYAFHISFLFFSPCAVLCTNFPILSTETRIFVDINTRRLIFFRVKSLSRACARARHSIPRLTLSSIRSVISSASAILILNRTTFATHKFTYMNESATIRDRYYYRYYYRLTDCRDNVRKLSRAWSVPLASPISAEHKCFTCNKAFVPAGRNCPQSDFITRPQRGSHWETDGGGGREGRGARGLRGSEV